MKERLRIYIIAFMFAPIVGGAEVRAEKQARQLQALGHDVTIVTLRHNKRWKRTEQIDGLTVIRVGGLYSATGTLRIGRLGHLPIDLLVFITLWRLRHRYDLLHSLQLSPLAGVAALIGKLTHKPIVVSIPSTGPGKRQRQEDATLMADTLTSTDYLKVGFKDIVVGDIAYLGKSAFGGQTILNYLKRSDAYYQILSSRSLPYMSTHGFRTDRIVRIPNGVDAEKFCPDAQKRPDPSQTERAILCVARLQYPKGVDVLLHAWGRMMREPDGWRAHLKPRLLIAGEGPLQTQLERMTAELGIQESVEFLGLRRDVIPLLQQAWAFVLPSRWEGMPNALLEAMACGLPSIATRVSGSEDIISDGINGLLVEPEQPAALAEAMRTLIADTEMAQRLAHEGRATIMRDYQLTSVAERCVELYHRALTNDQSATPLLLKGEKEYGK